MAVFEIDNASMYGQREIKVRLVLVVGQGYGWLAGWCVVGAVAGGLSVPMRLGGMWLALVDTLVARPSSSCQLVNSRL